MENITSINDLSLKERRKLIRKLITYDGGKISEWVDILMCSYAAATVLNKVQSNFIESCNVDRRSYKLGQCYGNSSEKIYEGFLYVEGIARSLDLKDKYYHAWNYKKKQGCLDFTFAELSSNYTYQGVVVPSNILTDVAMDNGGKWGPVIPYLNSAQLNEVINYNKSLIFKTEKCNSI